jgi:hypothetical protein
LRLLPDRGQPGSSPWSQCKSTRGRKKTVDTHGYACPQPGCDYFGITDANIHALVGYGWIDEAGTIRKLCCQACHKTFSVRKGTPLYYLKTDPKQIEIVFTQMTKAGFFAFGRGWDYITDFHTGIVNDDPVNQQFYQLPTLSKIKLIQGRLNTLAKILDMGRQFGDIDLALSLKFKLTHLLAQTLLGLVQFLPLALELISTDDLSQENFQQTSLLTFKLSQRFFNTLAARLQSLGQPFTRLSSLQLVRDQIWVS